MKMGAVEAREITDDLKHSHQTYDSVRQVHWKTVRQMLIALCEGCGYKALGYKTFKDFIYKEFKQDHHYFCDERKCGQVEIALGIPICTYNANALRPLRQFRGIAEDYRKTVDKTDQLALLKQCWGIARENADRAGRQMPNADDLIAAKLRMHYELPDLVKKPSAKNGAEVWRIKYEQAQATVKELEAMCTSLSIKAVEAQAELKHVNATQSIQLETEADVVARKVNQKLRSTISDMQHQITLLHDGNKVLLAKNKELLQANQNLVNRKRLGIQR